MSQRSTSVSRTVLFAVLGLTLFAQPAYAGLTSVMINGEVCKVNAADEKPKKGKSTKKSASHIHFTQASISPNFMNGHSVEDTTKADIANFPPIRVFDPYLEGDEVCKETYSLDNRRLYVAQKYDAKIKTVEATADEILDALSARDNFNIFWKDVKTFENCYGNQIFFDQDEAKGSCFKEDPTSSEEGEGSTSSEEDR